MSTDTAHRHRNTSGLLPAPGTIRHGRTGATLLIAAYLGVHALALLIAAGAAVHLTALLPAGPAGVVGFLGLGLGSFAVAPAVARRAFAALVPSL